MKKITIIILTMISIFFISCTNSNSKKEDIKLDIVINGTSNYEIICSENASTDFAFSVKYLANAINDYTGSNFFLSRDSYINDEEIRYEILVGNTNREETKTVLENLKPNSYAFKIINNCLVIVGTNDTFTTLAIYDFYNKIILNNAICNKDSFVVTNKDEFEVNFSKEFDLKEMIKNGYTVKASISKFITSPAIDDIKVAQGACTDDEFIYFILRDSNDSKAIITKYDMEGNFIKQSDIIYLGHGNDMTYDFVNDRIIVSHGVKEANTYSIIDKDKLTVINTFDITEGGGGCIAYNKTLDRYVTSKGGLTINFYDNNFNTLSLLDREELPYTAQGVGTDNEYIYFPMSGSSDNILATYDWEGNFITNILIDTRMESESMFYSNGIYYINFYVPGTGAVLYKAEFTISFEY